MKKALLFIISALSLMAIALTLPLSVKKNVSAENRPYLIPGGEVFGVKFYTNGAIVVDISYFESENGRVSPAKSAGIHLGDIITHINNIPVKSNSDISEAVNNYAPNNITLTVIRDSVKNEIVVTPEKCVAQEAYRIGMWVRDSTAGLGTVTYYNTQSNTLAGLGHGISDIDTGILMPMEKGEVIGARVTDIVTGKKGSPGQLMGAFNEDIVYGTLIGNSEKGIIASLQQNAPTSKEPLPIAYKNEIKEGQAYILCTVDDGSPQKYDVEIEKINFLSGGNKNMIVKITDTTLLEKTGGIVQGMSGSPIIQDGKLIGAVTHVLVNDPTTGYGIFIENMLETAHSVQEQLKEAP